MTDSPVSAGSGSPVLLPNSNKHLKLFVLSSPEQNSLQRMADALANYTKDKLMEKPSAIESVMSDLAFTLSERRTAFQWRSAFVASSAKDLTSALTQRVKGSRAGKPPKLTFVFTGQGAQWHAMGRELLAHDVYARTLKDADEYLSSLGADWSVMTELAASPEDSRINNPRYSQPLCSVVQIALVNLLSHWGVKASAVVGHSSGEIAAAYAAGALSAHDCFKVAYHRGRLSDDIKTIKPELKGGMMSVGLSEDATNKYLEKLAPSEIAIIACINSPSNVTVSGDSLALDKLEGLLKLDEVFARRLKVENAYHSPHMEVIADAYRNAIMDISVLSPTSAPTMFSSVTGQPIPSPELNASYWIRNMVSPVQFVQAVNAMIPAASQGGGRRRRGGLAIDTLVELGPHSALQGPLKQILTASGRAEDISYHSLLARKQDAAATALSTAGALWAKGQVLDFSRVNSLDTEPYPSLPLVDLPTYSWNHSHRYWHETDTMQTHRFRNIPRLDLVGKPVDDYNPLEPRWKNILRNFELPWMADHKVQGTILYPAAGMLCAVLEAALQLADKNQKVTAMEFRDITIDRALVVPSNDEGVTMELQMKPKKAGVNPWWHFGVYSVPKGGEYVQHASGLVQILYEPKTAGPETVDEASQEWTARTQEYKEFQRDCKDEVRPEDFYDKWDSRGLNYGPLFRTITQIHNTSWKGCSTLKIPDTKSVMPLEYEYDHLLHPATLDGIFQTMFTAIISNQGLVPTSIDSMYVSADLPKGAGSELRGFTKASRKGFRHYVGDVTMSDSAWSAPKIVVKGFLGTQLGVSSAEADPSDSSALIRKLCSSFSWREDIDQLTQKDAQVVLQSASKDASTSLETITDLEQAARIYMSRALASLSPDAETSAAPHLVHFVQWMRRRTELVNLGNAVVDEKEVLDRVAVQGIDGKLLTSIGQSLPAILDGSVLPESLLAHDDAFSHYRTDSIGLKGATDAMLKWIDLQAHKRPGLDYLELGAGQGAISTAVMKVLVGSKTPRVNQYVFTDSDPACLESAQKNMTSWSDRMQYKKLDLDKDLSDQGFEKESVDVILAGNVSKMPFPNFAILTAE